MSNSRCQIKKIFGISIHKNMSASDLKDMWDKVDGTIKKKFSSLTTLINTAAATEKAIATTITTYSVAKKALDTQNETVLAAAAIAAGNVAYATAKAAEVAAKTAIEKAKDLASEAINKAVSSICSQVDQTGEQNKDTENEL